MTALATPPQATTGRPAGPVRRRRRSPGTALLAQGEPMLWLTSGALWVCLLMIVGLLGLVVRQGIATFWPGPLVQVRMGDGRTWLGEVARSEQYAPADGVLEGLQDPERIETARRMVEQGGGTVRRRLLRTGNFDVSGTHFTWVSDYAVAEETRPEWAVLIERQTWGRFYGEPVGFEIDGELAAEGPEQAWELFTRHHGPVRDRWQAQRRLETEDIGHVNARLEAARLAVLGAERRHGSRSAEHQAAQSEFDRIEQWAQTEFDRLTSQIAELREENARFGLRMRTADGEQVRLPLAEVVRAFAPNRLSTREKLAVYASRWWEFLSDVPREANSEGGVFPALFGTALMTLLMSVAVVPFGVLAALYLREYAKAGPIVSAVRIAINNLAGVPSIVFGVFGLGFFCYGIGAFIDGGPTTAWTRGHWMLGAGVLAGIVIAAAALGLLLPRRVGPGAPRRPWVGRAMGLLWLAAVAMVVLLIARSPFFEGFYRDKLPNPTFGKGALVWASLTLALLTLPVVIVATEEALSAVPNSMREGSYACGGSKWQTIRRIVLPRAMPGIMTGTILAMARGAGEVAPLMLVGAVKLAPELPIAGEWPFGVNRSFMHLGFHIYDLGFQSQNSEAAKPIVYTTTLLLIGLIATLNLTAIWLRARLKRKFVGEQF